MNVTNTKELWTKLTKDKQGTKREGIKQKNLLGIAIVEGKKPLLFQAYMYLAQILLESDSQARTCCNTHISYPPMVPHILH
jgi:hypothetical protein